MDHFSVIGNIASILGFLVTLYLLISINKIKNFYLFTARTPEQLKKFRAYISKLNQSYNNFENAIEDVELELTKVEVVLEWFQKTSNKQIKSDVKLAIKLITDIKKNGVSNSKENIWNIYLLLSKIFEKVQSTIKDNQWERL